MRKWTLAFIILFFAAIFAVNAGGRKDNESHEVEDPAGFAESVNIQSKKTGKWNFYMEAKDKGGNATLAGPHNIYIDPVSDLPIALIINPMPRMHVQGNLNIVGTALDDDGVGYVELVISRGSDGKGEVLLSTRAVGAEFWSYFLDTTNTEVWRDGEYTITAWAVDINGLSGISDNFPVKSQKKHQVVWNLDRKKPDIQIKSHELGDLVSGKVSVKGTIWDGNGIASLQYSLDGGTRFQSAGFKYDKKADIYNFDISIDTKSLSDGPEVIMFRSRDEMRSEGVLSFLVFVNNTGPEVQIVYPEAQEAVSGIFSVAGYASHAVGVKSLTWKLGKETGEMPLIVGNPWWVQEFDIRGQNTKSLDLEIRAVDVSGNATVVKRKLLVDQEADLPKVELNEPVAGAVVPDEGLTFIGMATDNHGVESIFYSLDGTEAVEVPCSVYFQFTVPDIVPGPHNLEVWAKDITGVVGRKLLVKGLVSPGPAPDSKIAQVRIGAGKTAEAVDFYTGIEINSEASSSLDLMVNSGSSLQSISYQLGSKAPVVAAVKGSKGGEYIHNIPIPPDIDFGQVKLEIKVKDIYERETVLEEYIRVTDLTSPRVIDGHTPANRLSNGPVSLRGVNGEYSWPSQIMVARGEKKGIPISGTIDPSLQVSKAVFKIPGHSDINASVKNGEINGSLPADLPADLTEVTLFVSMKTGETYEASGEFWLLRPRGEGQMINTSETFTWVRPDTSISGGRILLSSSEGLMGIYNGRPLQSVEVAVEDGTAGSLSATVDRNGRVNLTCSATGSYGPVRFMLTDKDGKTFTTGEYRFLLAGGAPRLTWEENPEGKWVHNEVAAKFRVSGANKIKSVDLSTNLGVRWQPLLQSDEIEMLQEDSVIERTLNISSLPDGAVVVSVRVVDEANKEAVRSFTVNKDTVAPETRLIVPISEARVNGTIRLGIAIKEAGKLSTVSYERPETTVNRNAAGGDAVEEEVLPAISKVIYSNPAKSWNEEDLPLTFLDVVLDAYETPLDKNMKFVFTDATGNASSLSNWSFIIDSVMDLPIVQITLPVEDEVITSDFIISGVCFDDDEIAKVYWSMDDGPEQILPAANGYSMTVLLSSMTDNEHSIKISAEDIYGVRGEAVKRNFRVSLEEPKGAVVAPEAEEIVGGTIVISGTASDENGISKVQVSLDNGNSYNDAKKIEQEQASQEGEGVLYAGETEKNSTVEWEYSFNSKIIKDGNHAVFVRVWDNYDVTAMYSFLVNIDNTPPELTIDTPTDGAGTTGPIYVTGQVMDNMKLDTVTIRLSSLEGVEIPKEMAVTSAKLDALLLEEMNLSALPDGNYNVEIWATDMAKNVSRVSRNINLVKEGKRNYADILYPLNGEYVQGYFNLYGIVGGIDKASSVTLLINGVSRRTESVTEAGYFRFDISQEDLNTGANEFVVRSDFGGRETVESVVCRVNYQPYGAWVTVDTLSLGDFVYERPWLMGRAGYELTLEDHGILEDKKADKDLKADVAAKKLSQVELSFDNGRTFFSTRSAPKGYDWRYRLEDGEMAEGVHYLIVRATMANGDTAVTRLLVQVDKTPPRIRLITPEAGGRYNEELQFAALASDDVELNSMTYHLRKGDKAFYGVPGFIKGLYVEGIIPPVIKLAWEDAPVVFAGGATFFDIGLGLSFFDDNVKLQVSYGQMTQSQYELIGGTEAVRYGGHVLGLKLLANIYQLPFGSFLGPDWEWLSATFAIGANFSLFDLAKEGYTQSGNSTWMSALLAQIEFPRVTIPKRTWLRTFSFFAEGQLWFVPTDVNASSFDLSTVIPHMTLGLRAYIF